jgi:predicted amidohydrolase YtcJ
MAGRFGRCSACATLVVLATGVACTPGGRGDGADELVLRNGIVVTVDDAHPRATAVLVRGQRIAAVGSDAEVARRAGAKAQVVDLGGRTVVPGFIDAHSHRLGDFAKVGYRDAGAVVPDTLAEGWTGLHELFVNQERLDALRALDEAGRLPLRVDAYLPVNSPDVAPYGNWYTAYRPGQQVSPHVRIAGLKVFVDFDTGREIRLSQAELDGIITTAHQQGWQVAAKSIGSATLERILNAFAAAQGNTAGAGDRGRIEHILSVTPAQTARMRMLGLVPSIQTNNPGQLVGDPDVAAFVAREPAGAVAPWRSLAEAGLPLAGGSGWPSYYAKEDPPFASPVRLLYQAVTRTGNNGSPPEPWMRGQELTVAQSLRAYTMGSAYAVFADTQRGSITEGKLADLVVLSQNPLEVPVQQILGTKVLVTMIDGRARWCAPDAGALCAHPAPVTSAGPTRAETLQIAKGQRVPLAVLAPKTGAHPALADVITNSAALAVTDAGSVAGFSVDVKVADDGCAEAGGGSAATQVVADGGYAAVLGPSCSSAALGGLPELERAGLATISCTATKPDLGALAPNVFNRTVPDDAALAKAGLDVSYVETLAAVKALEARYAAQFGGLPEASYRPFIGYCYDATMVLLRAIGRAGSLFADGALVIDRARLVHELRATSGYAGVTGAITFDANGNLNRG